MKHQEEKGSALLVVMLVAMSLSILGLGITLVSLDEYSSSAEYENHLKALQIADAGFNATKSALRGKNFTTVLSASSQAPEFIEGADDGAFAYRNPLPLLEARSINFLNPPASRANRTVYGLLTPPTGVVIGNGRYFAKVSDNDDGDGDIYMDSDSTVVIRVVGIHRSGPGQSFAYDSTFRNSVAVIETMVRRDMAMNLGAPLTLIGPNVSALFEGNAFRIQGDSDAPGISILNDDVDNGDGSAAAQEIYDSLIANQHNNITGASGDFGSHPSIRDDTEEIRESEDEELLKLMDPEFLAELLERIPLIADEIYPDGTSLSGGEIQLGTHANPQITYVDGDFQLSGNGSGSGLLVVRGKFDYQGAFNYHGLVLVLGQGELEMGGANKSITGGLLLANLTEDGFGPASLTLSGNSRFYFDGAMIQMAVNLFPLKTLMWREITPEIEP